MDKPRSRDFHLVRELDGELIILDSRHEVAHRLAPEAATVWRACDGSRDVGALAAHTGQDAARVGEVLAELRTRDLLDDESGQTRRGMLRTALVAGAAAASVPLITSVVMPSAAQAFDSAHQNPTGDTTGSSTTSSSADSSNPSSVSPSSGNPTPVRATGGRAHRTTRGGDLQGVAGPQATHAPTGTSILGAGSGIAPSGGATGSVGAGHLPFTGSDVLRTVAAGGVLVAAGVTARAYAGPPPER